MAWTYPLSLADFYDKIRVAIGSPNWELARNDQTSGLGSLDPLNAELASPLWRASIQLPAMPNAEADELITMLEMLCHPGRKFFFSNPKHEYPASDPGGEELRGDEYLKTTEPWDDDLLWGDLIPWGSAVSYAPKILALGSNNRSLSLSGLPPGYKLSIRDMLAFDYGPEGQKRRAMHRVVETVIADEDGITGLFEVFPHIRAGAAVNDPVFLEKPAILASVIPGTFDPGTADTVNTVGISFGIIQRLI